MSYAYYNIQVGPNLGNTTSTEAVEKRLSTLERALARDGWFVHVRQCTSDYGPIEYIGEFLSQYPLSEQQICEIVDYIQTGKTPDEIAEELRYVEDRDGNRFLISEYVTPYIEAIEKQLAESADSGDVDLPFGFEARVGVIDFVKEHFAGRATVEFEECPEGECDTHGYHFVWSRVEQTMEVQA